MERIFHMQIACYDISKAKYCLPVFFVPCFLAKLNVINTQKYDCFTFLECYSISNCLWSRFLSGVLYISMHSYWIFMNYNFTLLEHSYVLVLKNWRYIYIVLFAQLLGVSYYRFLFICFIYLSELSFYFYKIHCVIFISWYLLYCVIKFPCMDWLFNNNFYILFYFQISYIALN